MVTRTIKLILLQKFFIGLLLLGFHTTAQKCAVNAGTKTLYNPQQLNYTSAPKGYTAAYISHVGRHGARHLTKDVNTYQVYTLLRRADSLKALTPAGQKLWKMVLVLREIEVNGLKSISERGKQEQKNIADRMVRNFSGVFAANPLKMSVEVTKEIRTSQSAEAFLTGLAQSGGKPEIVRSIDDTALRFYDLSPAYTAFEEKGDWITQLQEIERSAKTEKLFPDFSSRIFTSSFTFTDSDSREFCHDIYGFASIISAIRTELGAEYKNLDFYSFFSCRELSSLSKIDQAEDYLLKGPGIDSMGIQVKIAAPLLVQFIKDVEAWMSSGENRVDLRFAHAETISPFAALLQLNTASRPALKIDEFDKVWKASEVIPLSSNIQWIMYRKKNSDDLLVKILLNEKESSIKGLPTNIYPYYHWSSMKKFYLALLTRLGVKPGDNMNQYLKGLKL